MNRLWTLRVKSELRELHQLRDEGGIQAVDWVEQEGSGGVKVILFYMYQKQ